MILRHLLASTVLLLTGTPAMAATTFNLSFSLRDGAAVIGSDGQPVVDPNKNIIGSATLTADDGTLLADGRTQYRLTDASGSFMNPPGYADATGTITGLTDFFGYAANTLFVQNGAVSYDSFGLSIDVFTFAFLFNNASGKAEMFEGDFNINTLAITPAAAVTPVPEPATWAMMTLGFAAAAGALRRRKTRVSVSFAQ